MSRSLNKVMLIGHVGKQPEFNFTSSGMGVATFSLATTDSWKDKNGTLHEHTDWHNIVVWNTQYRNLADIVHKLVHKGSKLFIEGKIRNRSYDTREGIKKNITEIVADNIMLLDPKPQQSQSDELPAPEPIDFKGEFSSNMSENDIPF